MTWISRVSIDEADGLLKRLYDAAIKRAGRVFGITHAMSQNPPVMRDAIRLYATLMMGESPLSRVQREMLATVTAGSQDCEY